MDNTKTYVFPDGNNMNGFGGNWDNPLWALIFLAFLGRGGFGGGFGGGNADTAFVSSQLGQAIAGNANAISNLATALNCTEGQIQASIANIQSAVQQVANANNMNAMQILNSVNTGNSAIVNAIQSCCCDTTNAVNQGFGNLRYENAAQFCQTRQAVDDQTDRIIAKIDAVQDEAKNNKIAELTAQLTAATSRAERQAELAPIYKALADIQCRQPETVTVPQNNGVLVPSCVAWQYGLNGLGLNPYGVPGSIWS